MLSRYTYALWNFSIVVMTSFYATGNILRGTYWLAAAEIILAVLFLIYAILAATSKGMYRKHPVHWLPNGTIVADDLTHEQIDASRVEQGLPPIYGDK